MIKTLPKIIISVAALFGMFINLHLIHTLSDHSAVSGVEELLRAVAGAECNTVIELKPEHHAA